MAVSLGLASGLHRRPDIRGFSRKWELLIGRVCAQKSLKILGISVRGQVSKVNIQEGKEEYVRGTLKLNISYPDP
jgi:hypothetical protein